MRKFKMVKQFQANLSRYDITQEIEYCGDSITDIERVISTLEEKKKILITLRLEKLSIYLNYLNSINLSPGQSTTNEETQKINQFLLEIDDLENNKYSLEESSHFHFYDFLFKLSRFNNFLEKDFLINYKSFVNLVVDGHHAILSQKDEIIMQFNQLIENLKELNKSIEETKKERLQNVDNFYNFVKEYGVENKKDLINYDLFIVIYHSFVFKNSNQLALIEQNLLILLSKLNNVEKISEDDLIAFIDEINFEVIKLFENFGNNSFVSKLKNNHHKIRDIRLVYNINFYFNKIRNLRNSLFSTKKREILGIIPQFDTFIRLFARRKFQNYVIGLIEVKFIYYFLEKFLQILDERGLDQIQTNFGKLNIYLEYVMNDLDNNVTKIKNPFSNKNIQKLAYDYVLESRDYGFKRNNFEFVLETPKTPETPDDEGDENFTFSADSKAQLGNLTRERGSKFSFSSLLGKVKFWEKEGENDFSKEALMSKEELANIGVDFIYQPSMKFGVEDIIRTGLFWRRSKVKVSVDIKSEEYNHEIEEFNSLKTKDEKFNQTYLNNMKLIVRELRDLSLEELKKLFFIMKAFVNFVDENGSNDLELKFIKIKSVDNRIVILMQTLAYLSRDVKDKILNADEVFSKKFEKELIDRIKKFNSKK